MALLTMVKLTIYGYTFYGQVYWVYLLPRRTCEMLMKEPLEPHVAMASGALRKWSSRLHTSPASPRMLESSPLMSDSSV